MPTAGDIITKALQKIEVLGEGETASGQKADDCLDALNAMLDSWSLDKAMVYLFQSESFAWGSGVSSRTIGATGNFATVRPIEVLDAFMRDANNQDYPLAVWGSQRYDEIFQKTLAGWPRVLYYEPSYPNGTLRVVEVPQQDFTIYLRTRKQFTRFSGLSTDVELPVGYERALIFNLAVEVAPDYNKLPSDVVNDIAQGSKELIRRANLPEVVADYDRELNRHASAGFSIYRGS